MLTQRKIEMSYPPNVPDESSNPILRKFYQRIQEVGQAQGSTGVYIDTYRSLKQLKEMLKEGQITEYEYEVLKIELLTR